MKFKLFRLLPAEYFPRVEDQKMSHVGNLPLARDRFFTERNNNLKYLLRNRYSWMNPYINGKSMVVELGSGAGFAREFLENKNVLLTDFKKNEWIDLEVDALKTPFQPESIDVVIASHMIHHLARPHLFFKEVERILKPNGLVLIQEIQTSLLMKALLRIMHHEGWSDQIDVFDETLIANDPLDPWSANTAIPELLFKQHKKFESNFPAFKIKKDEFNECLIFPLSGGVIANKRVFPNLPIWLLSIIDKLDKKLIKVSPKTFALGRSVVLQKCS